MNISKQLKRVRVQADHLFLRGERTDVLGDLRAADDRVEALRQLCEAFKTSVEKTLHTHNTPEEKRVKKLLDNQGAEALKDALNALSLCGDTQQPVGHPPLFRDLVEQVAESQQALSLELIRHDEQMEVEVLLPITKILKEDFTNCAKIKKQLKQVGQELDSARTRHNSAVSGNQSIKIDNLKEEMDDAETRLEIVKDNYACELFNVISKEREMCQLVYQFLYIRREFHFLSKQKLDLIIPKMENQLEGSTAGQVYGRDLNEHLKIAKKKIAVPIEICIQRLVQIGLQEEGLFRMAGSTSKVKRLKGAFDANLIDLATLSANGSTEYHKDYDVHVVGSALKQYLRELPEPLLTYTLYKDWVDAVKTQDRDQRMKELWSVVKRLPKPNFSNLSYVVQFLCLLASYRDQNKMSFNNIAIVMAPNLIWSADESNAEDIMSTLGRNMCQGNLHRQIVELLVEFAKYFFEEPIDFGVPEGVVAQNSDVVNGSTPIITPSSSTTTPPSYVTLPRQGHRRNVSSDFVSGGFEKFQVNECESPKQPQRRKKPAPQPPQGRASDYGGVMSLGNSSPEQIRNSFPSSRDGPTPAHPRTNFPTSSPINRNTPPKDSNMPPTPAVRLHHAGSIRRPNIEPPKPPIPAFEAQNIPAGVNTGPFKPPRPVPPVIERTAESAASVPSMNSSVDSSSMSSSFSSSTEVNATNHPASTHTSSAIIQEASVTTPRLPIGFEHLHDEETVGAPSDDNGDVLRREGNDSSASSMFRKSLENVILQQAAGQPLVLPRHQQPLSGVEGSTSREDLCSSEGQDEAPVRVVPPVPAMRTIKDNTVANCDITSKPEPVSRQDKPALPEKPMTLPRPAVGPRSATGPGLKQPVVSPSTDPPEVSYSQEDDGSEAASQTTQPFSESGNDRPLDTRVVKSNRKTGNKKQTVTRKTTPVQFSHILQSASPGDLCSSSVSDHEDAPLSPKLLRRRSRSGGSEDNNNNNNSEMMSRSVSEKVSAFSRNSLRTSNSAEHNRSVSSERRVVRTSIHQLQDQLFRDSTLEQANGQLIIKKAPTTEHSQSRPYDTGSSSLSSMSRSMDDLDKTDDTGGAVSQNKTKQLIMTQQKTKCNNSSKTIQNIIKAAQHSKQKHRYSRNNSCDLLVEGGKPLAPPKQFQDTSQSADGRSTSRKPRRQSPVVATSSSPKLGKKSTAPLQPISRSDSNASPSSESSSLSKFQARSFSMDKLEQDREPFSTDF